MEKIIQWLKLKPTAVVPTKRAEDAGFDLYTTATETVIAPHETKLLNTGLATIFDADIVGIVKERGSTGSLGLSVRSGVIDSGYRGEWKVAITNLNNYPVVFKKASNPHHEYRWGSRKVKKLIYPLSKAIAQVIFIELPSINSVEINEEEFRQHTSERGEGGWGSSGK